MTLEGCIMKNIDPHTKTNIAALLDAISAAIFIVDEKNRILDINKHATSLVNFHTDETLLNMCGEVLHCLHAQNAPKGCGTTKHCPDCVINNTIKDSCSGKTVVKRKAELITQKNNKQSKSVYLISATPYISKGENLTILSLEDISELALLRNLLPICAKCKKIRNDNEYWETIEEYMDHYLNTKLSHGICPDCSDELYSGQDWYDEMKNKKE